MSNPKRVLVLGATGAMGQYLVPKLAQRGYHVDACALDAPVEPVAGVSYMQGDLKKREVLEPLLKRGYDGIVDFMIYPSAQIPYYLPHLLAATDHYIYFSSYRAYGDTEHPVRESSPLLLECTHDEWLRASDDYCIYKARGEHAVRTWARQNWTIVRPAITYSRMRYQLVTLEAYLTVARAMAGKPVAVPAAARDIQGTLSWAGDVAEMLARLLFNPQALGETYSVCTAEHHTWGEIADLYHDICGLNAVWVDTEDYLKIFNGADDWNTGARWQLQHDRLYHRVMDNSKVLAATGLTQAGLKTLHDGLEYEIARCTRPFPLAPWQREHNAAMDALLGR